MDFMEKHLSKSLYLDEESMKEILESIRNEKSPATKAVTTRPDERPKDTYNRFFRDVSIDANYLYKVLNSLHSALQSHSHLSSSYLSDIKSELDKLELNIKELKSKKQYQANTVVVSESFKTAASFEDPTKFEYLDRDGTKVEMADISHRNTEDMLILQTVRYKDVLHNKNGKTIGKIKVLDYRGVPLDTINIPEHAIDGSDSSYWDCTVISKDQLKMPFDGHLDGGAYMKFSITLANTSDVSEISITPFSIYPIEVIDIIIEDRSVLSSVINAKASSVNTMTFNFSSISTDKVTIIIRQPNYTKGPLVSNEKIDEGLELLELSLGKRRMSFVSEDKKESEYADDNIYLKYAEKHRNDIDKYNDLVRRGE
jgi:hypothetical protein